VKDNQLKFDGGLGDARRASQSARRIERVPSARSRGLGLVLIADDTADARELYAMYLTHQGFTVQTVIDGDAAVRGALARRPDVIVMDLAMPRLDGIAATQRLQHDARTRHIPVIIVTGYPYKAVEQGALEAGAAGFLTKPCLPEDLEQEVRRVMGRPSSSAARRSRLA
jgi:two-component system, cell cycle response regulator DivK